MKHVWKSKEKTDTDVEEALHENENIKREYVIQVVRETKYKWWSVVAIYMLVMFLFGLSYYMLRTYSISETMSVICQRYLPISESQKSSPSNEALETSTESLTVDKFKLLENENDLPPYTKAFAKSIAQSSSEVESDNTVRTVFDPLLLSLLDDLEIQRLKKNSMEDAHSLTKSDNMMPEDLISISKFISEFENNSNKGELFPLLNIEIADINRDSLTKNDNMMPEDLTSVSKLFSEFENDSNKDELLFPLLNVNKMADADAHSLTKSDNMMPADDVKDLKTVSSSKDLKVGETHDEKSSVESGVVICPPDKSDEFSTEFSSSESAQLEEKDNTDLESSDYQFRWLNIPSEYFFVIPMPYFWNNSEEQASQLAYIRDSVKDIKQTISNIKLSYTSSCKIIITKGVVDATLCPGFFESGAESNLESSASSQTTTTLFSTQTNIILPSIQTSTMLPSTQTTTTTHITEEDHDDFNDYYYDSKDDFLRNPFMPRMKMFLKL